jgi:hypothetical protein
MRRWRQHVAESDAGASAGSDAYSDANAYSDADAYPDSHAHADTHAERRDDDHHHLRGCVSQDADCARGNTRHVREQRHAGA